LNALDQQKIKKQNKPRKVNYLHINKAVLFASPATKCKRKIIENKIECSLPFLFFTLYIHALAGAYPAIILPSIKYLHYRGKWTLSGNREVPYNIRQVGRSI